MRRLLLARLVVALPTLFLIVTLSFFLMRAAPGGPFDGDRKLAPEVARNVAAKYGLDRPLAEQYLRYLAGVARGDLGPSLKYRGKQVTDIIAEGLPTSAAIGLSALLLAGTLGTALGIAAALRQNHALDRLLTTLGSVGVCIPAFVLAPLLLLLFASRLGWLPTGGISAGWRSYVLPVVVLALPQLAFVIRLVRAGMIEALRSPYIRTARSRGLSERRIVIGHALRAGLLPLVSYLGPAAAGLITGSLAVEQIFGIPGLGRSFVLGALQRDYTVVLGVVLLYAALILALNLVTDLVQALLDPRIRA